MRNISAMFSLFIAITTLVVRAEAPLVTKVENAIRNTEPGWRCIRGVLDAPWQLVPGERLLVASECDQRSQTGKRQSVDLRIFQVDSPTDAKICLAPVRDRKVAAGWKVQEFKIGDEGYLATFTNKARFEIQFRKGVIFATLSSDSFRLVDKFAKLVASQINGT